MSIKARSDRVFKALADENRRTILDLLKDQPKTTGDLCDHFKKKLDRCTVMQHLAVLEKADLVIVKREGKFRWNYLNSIPIQEIYDRWIHQYARKNVQLLKSLKTDLESGKK